ncbi:MAG TPA: hypothetical protein VK968_11220, partial [Roseimicrobium sp.]|nr:hypothetical protein [Roseimicrobium sp.]
VESTEKQSEMTPVWFNHSATRSFILVGPQRTSIIIVDNGGPERRMDFGHECLEVWMVPGDFKPDFPGFFDAGAVVPPEDVYRSTGLRVYVRIRRYLTPEEQKALAVVRSSRWAVSFDPSWSRWKKDISDQLRTLP